MNWIVIRGSGLVAYYLLALSAIWGLLLANKLKLKFLKAKPLTFAHESLAIGSLLATGVHMVALYLDEFVHFGLADLLVPGVSAWRPAAVALGVVGFYATAIVTVSFYLKRVIGQKAWRVIHFLSFGSLASVLVHGLMAGTDSAHPLVFASYVVTAAAVIGLIAMRITQPARRSMGSGARSSGKRDHDPSPAAAAAVDV